MIFIDQKPVISHFDRWLELFSELFRLIKGVEVIVFDSGFIEYGGTMRDTAVILVQFDKLIYPLFRVNPEEYYKKNIIKQRIFNDARLIIGPIASKVQIENTVLNTIIDAKIENFKVCITKQRVAYGIIMDGVFITFKPTYIPGDLKTFSSVPEVGKAAESMAVLEKIRKKFPGSIIQKGVSLTLMSGKTKLAIAHLEPLEDLWSAILELEPSPDMFDEVFPFAISKHNIYNLLLMEFTAHADRNRNAKLRKIITDLIKNLDINDIASLHEFTGTLKKNIESPNDIGVINSIVAQNINDKKLIIELIDAKKFNFDKNNYKEMAKMPVDELRGVVNEFIKQYVVATDKMPPPPKNLTLPIKKLEIQKDLIGDFVELLVADLQNPLKLELMRSGALSSYLLLDIFDFEKRPNETIKIKLA